MIPTNLGARAWAELKGTRLTIVCLSLLMAFWLAGEAASLPDVGSRLRQWGLADFTGSAGFVSVLVALVLNLLAGTVARLRSETARDPASDEWLRSGFESKLAPEAFGALAERWARDYLGSVTVNSGVAARRGRLAPWVRALSHWALIASLGGAVIQHQRSYQARVLIEEGARARALERVRGRVPADWKPFRGERGQEIANHFAPGFEIERATSDGSSASRSGALLHFRRDGAVIGSVVVTPGRPARFEKRTIHLLQHLPGSTQNVSLLAVDRSTGGERRFPSLSPGQSVDLEDFGFKVVEVRPATDEGGASVEIEYREAGTQPRRFWLFTDYPDYDFAHRKKTAQNFVLESVRARTAAEIRIGEEPGASWVWAGLLLSALLGWIGVHRSEERYWIRWKPGRAVGAPTAIEFCGWSGRPLLFEPRFFKRAALLEKKIKQAEEGEANHGSGSA